ASRFEAAGSEPEGLEQHPADERERIAAGHALEYPAEQNGLRVLVAEDRARREELRRGLEHRDQARPIELPRRRIEQVSALVAARVRQQMRHPDRLAVNRVTQLGQCLA